MTITVDQLLLCMAIAIDDYDLMLIHAIVIHDSDSESRT